MRRRATEAVNYIKKRVKKKPLVGIILGSGLGRLVNAIAVEHILDYREIPNFPESTVSFHKGRLIFGRLKNKRIVAMQGRFHYYEGYSAREITLPVVVMKLLGVKYLIISNASGGLNPEFSSGDVMLIKDHINLIPDNPLRGRNDSRLGPRFPDMYHCYDRKLLKLAEKVALEKKIVIRKGVYVAVPGPNLETAAEYRFLRIIGADAVGMSTVPEVIMARYLRLKVLGISVITDMGIADALKPASLLKILKAAASAEPKLNRIITGVIPSL
ncbi:purine-nucleoside phosphorylase [candidate division WOR-3 bacterium 4484_100]|uniref:Purine nucleoside phosphorylase n=1 Tax=candidate division WOR-3 bacterium 4484_100 TaxID=1936077 RepID=A0A1V4QDI1_UNCW3|nr:MAG: purine-nucleoside phosphorylase [candidate division WOR-3 bacterium 4484_100]